MKFSKQKFLVLSLILTTTFSPVSVFASNVTPPAKQESKSNLSESSNLAIPINEQVLVFDHYNHNALPANFRKSTDKITPTNCANLNLKGLNKLNISGSEQYSAENLVLLKKQLPSKKLVFVDLRQESHGFINGLPISWEGNGNKANIGLSREDVIKRNNEQLASIKLCTPLKIKDTDITPKTTFDEETLIHQNKDSYIRVTVTDTRLPKPEMVDYFVNEVTKLPKNSWLHFHCKEGIGRTTTFMIMYDMMHNAKDVPLNDIITRQIKLGNLESKESSLENEQRMILFKDFYEYCKKGNFKEPFSKFAPSYKGN